MSDWPPDKTWQDLYLCKASDLREGEAKGFDPWQEGRDSILVLRHGGQIIGYRNRCPHLNVSMEYRKDRFLSADGQRIICYAHGAHFVPASGLCIHGPCLGKSLTPVCCFVDSTGRVFLSGQASSG
ncbi:Rieske 2Fe-2S domain-containing protein [Pseudomonas sp. App30]